MQQRNEIHLERHNSVILMNIQGDITAFSEHYLNEAYKNANDQGASKILLKLEKDAYVNSGGIGVLIQILAQTRNNNQHIGITGASEHNKKIFKMVGITKFAKIYTSVENALEVMAEKS